MATATTQATSAASNDDVKHGQKNVAPVVCSKCSKTVKRGGATCTQAPTDWAPNAAHRWECTACEAERKEAERLQREAHIREGQVLTDVMPQLRKMGSFKSMRAGPSEWQAVAVMEINGRTYEFIVKEASEDN